MCLRFVVLLITRMTSWLRRAAAKLYISQPALSKQIRKLEDQLGTPLLIRDSRHVTLTPRGQRLLEDARQLLALAERCSTSRNPTSCVSRTSSK